MRRSPRRRPPRRRVVCFPHAGGGASSFSDWARRLPEDVELVRVQLPGREDHAWRPPARTVAELMPELGREGAALADVPLVFYGHSMGAIVAFELARELRRRGAPLPRALFVSGRRAPHLPLAHARPHAADDTALVDYLRRMGGVDERLLERPEWRRRFFPVLRADLEVSDLYAYTPEPPLPLPIAAFQGEDDTSVAVAEWQGWREHTSAGFTARTLPGAHFFSRRGRAALIDLIAEHLGAPRRAEGPLAPAAAHCRERDVLLPR